jgi:TP901 family phage tail tape measure protein
MDNMGGVIRNTVIVDVTQALQGIARLQTELNKLRATNTGTIATNISSTMNASVASVNTAVNTMNAKLGSLGAGSTGGLNNLNRNLNNSSSALASFGRSLKSHLGFIGTSLAIGGVVGAVHALTSLETEFHNLATVIPSMHENTTNFNGVMEDSFRLAERYGQKIEEVTESLRLMGRGYKDLNTVEKLSEISMKLAVADNFSAEQATRAIESTVAAYGKQANAVQFAEHVMDSMTAVSHTGMISANDLSAALQRSASAAHTVGVSYEELTAMIGSISRSTALSGATIGQGIKSILNSIHSDKAIGELEKMGVAVYQVGTNGEQEFRKISDVLLDVSLKSKVAGKDVETAFRSLAGGKFQVSKLSALLGDPQEYIRLMGVAVNSSGFTNKQLEIQLNTISRKFTTLKTQFEELITIGGQNSGLTSGIKDLLDVINQVIKGFNNLDPSVSAIAGSTTKWLIGLMALKSSVGFLINTYAILRTTIASATAAQTALNVATAANPWGALARVVLIAASALSTYAFFSGSALEAQDKLNQAQEDAITQKKSQISQIGQQVQFMETLGKTYAQLQDQLVEYADDEDKVTEIKKTMGTVVEQLTAIIGKEATDRVLASDDIQAALKEEMKIHGDKTTAIQTELDNLSAAQKANAQATIDMSNARIDAMVNEANQSIAAIDAIGEALGDLSKMKYQYYQGKADLMNSTAEMLQSAEAEDLPWYSKMGYDMMAQDTGIYSSEQAKEEAQAAQAQADAIRQEAIDTENNRKAKAQGVIVPELTKGIETGRSTGTVDTNEGTKKKGKGRTPGTGAVNAPDNSEEMFRLEKGHEVNHMLQEAKISTDQYSAALEILNSKESMFGFSTANSNEKLALMNTRIKELISQSMEYSELSREYEQQANDKIASNEILVAALDELKVSWKDLTKEEKQAFIQRYKDYIQDEKSLLKLLDLSDKLKVASSDAGKNASNIAADAAKLTLDIPMQKYKKQAQIDEQNKSHEIAGLGYDSTDEQRRVIEIKYAVKELFDAQQELNRVTELYGTDSEQYREARERVDNLKNSVDKLNNTKLDRVKSEVSDMIIELAQGGKSFGDIWKNVWKEFQADAIRSLMGVKHEASLLGSILGGTGSDGGGGLIGFFGGLFGAKKAHSGENIVSNAPKMHSGGEVTTDAPLKDDEVLRTLQVGERVLSRDANKSFTSLTGNLKNLNSNASLTGDISKLSLADAFKGTKVIATISQQSMETAKTMSVVAQQAKVNAEHLDRLDTQNKLMVQQNNMLLHMINEGGGGKTTVAQPVIMQQSMSDHQLHAQLCKMKSMGYQF